MHCWRDTHTVEDWTECAQTHTDTQKWKQHIHQFYSVHLADTISQLSKFVSLWRKDNNWWFLTVSVTLYITFVWVIAWGGHTTHAKFRRPHRKSGSPSKNMTSYFALELVKYPKSSPKPQNSPKWRSRILCEIHVKFHHSYKKLGSESKNVTSDFASEVAKYPKNPKTPK